MTIDIEKLVEILNEINYPVLFEVDLESIWQIDDDNISWNKEGNRFDLENGEGETYSGYLPEGYTVQDKYVICNVDTQCGQWVTHIFSALKEVTDLE